VEATHGFVPSSYLEQKWPFSLEPT